MPDALVVEFATWDVPARGPLWRKRDGSGAVVPAHLVSKQCNLYLHSLGIAQTLHTLRHWYGTATYAATGDLRLTQEVMGHATPTTTAGYAAWSPRKAAAVLRGLTVPEPEEERLREPDGSWVPPEAMARPSLRVVPTDPSGGASS